MEHFKLFASLRQAKSEMIDKLVEDLDLTDYKDTQAKNLSGGNKRKLQVGLAFVGDSCSLILLDEPTAGLEPVAALMVFVFGTFGIVVPSPGGMGTYHFFATEALKIYEVAPADAFSFANILFFSVQIGCNVVIGLLAFILLPIMNKGYIPKDYSKLPSHGGGTTEF